MVAHADSLSDSSLSQIRACFQTCVNVRGKQFRPITDTTKHDKIASSANANTCMFDLIVEHTYVKTRRITTSVTIGTILLNVCRFDKQYTDLIIMNITKEEQVYMNGSELKIVKVVKQVKHVDKRGKKKNDQVSAAEKSSDGMDKDDDPLGGLTFNVHINSDDMEAKNKLILPYELVGLVAISPCYYLNDLNEYFSHIVTSCSTI